MKTIFIPVLSKGSIKSLISKVKIEGKVGIVSSIQYLEQAKEASKLLKNSMFAGQVLGCNVNLPKKAKVDAFLYIGSAYFHPIFLAVKTNKPVYILNPITEKFSKVDEKEIERYKKRLKGKVLKFLSSENKGILVSVKPFQQKFKEALELKKKLNAHIFLVNTLDVDNLENFPDIDCWINTACPRIEGKNIINLGDIPKDYE